MNYTTGQANQFSATALAISGRGMLLAMLLTAGDSADATVTVYDGLDDSGTALFTMKAVQKTSTQYPQIATPFSTGLYLMIAGAGATVTAWT
jgi:hypothetical protein